MPKKKDKPVYCFVRKGISLIPSMEFDLDALQGIEEGQSVIVSLKHGRSSGRHRAYWLTLNECIKATECAPTVTALHSLIKLKTGFVEHVELEGGVTVAVPSSIAFESLEETDFIKYFEAAKRFLAETYGFVLAEKEPEKKNAA